MKFIKNNPSVQVVPADFLAKACQKFDICDKVMEQIILRGNDTIEKIDAFLNPTESAFLNPFDLNGMHALIERIKKAKEAQENVLVFGDYDVDGISATAIMLKALKVFGINAKYYLPNRYVDGYGLTIDVLKKIKRLYNPSLELVGILITMYNGRLNLSSQVMFELKKYYASKLFKTTILRNVKLSEAPGFGLPVIYYDKHCKGTEAYYSVTDEILERI